MAAQDAVAALVVMEVVVPLTVVVVAAALAVDVVVAQRHAPRPVMWHRPWELQEEEHVAEYH